MSKLEQLEREVESLAPDEYAAFSSWMEKRLIDAWDEQICSDAGAGKLDFLVNEAKTAYQTGTLRDWPDRKA